MAIAFAQATIHTRSKGHSAVAAAAYRAGIKLEDERTGLIHDFQKRADINFSEVLLPEGANEKFEDRDYLWNQLEIAERRKNSQLCKDIVLALPKELDLVHHIELARRFANKHFVSNGIPADINIHDGKSENPHAHILVPLRRLERDDFAKKKARDLNPEFAKGFIVTQDFWGEQWRDLQNDYAKEHDIELSVDLNHVIPEVHEGRLRGKDKHYTKEQNESIREARRELALGDMDNFINLLSMKNSVFSRRDLERLLFKTFAGDDKHYLIAMERILAHKDIIELGLGEDGKFRFTTRHHYVQECQLFEKVDALAKKKSHTSRQSMDKISTRFSLSNEQAEALNHVVGGGDVSVVCGKPGTGKTYMLKALNQHYGNIGCRTLGVALASKAAKGLEAESGIKSSTIASLNYRIASGKLTLNKNNVLVVDEAGMVDFASMNHLITAVNKAGSKIVLVGDSEQLKPIGKGDLFRGIAARVGYYAMEDIKRQRDLADRQASIALSKGKVDAALTHYEQKDSLCFSDGNEALIKSAVDNWVNDIESSDCTRSVMLSFTRDAVLKLNITARESLKANGSLDGKEMAFKINRGDKQQFNTQEAALESTLTMTPVTKAVIEDIYLTKGERILFKKKDMKVGVDNGDMGIITEIGNQSFTATLDNGREVTVKNNTYQHFDYGYALTVHKSQGMTVDNAHVVIDSPYWDKHLSYVAMTRHRDNLKIYANQGQYKDREALADTLSRAPTKDNVVDFPLDYAIRYGFDPDSIKGRAINKIAGLKNRIKDGWLYLVNYEAYLRAQNMAFSQEVQQEKRAVAKDCADYLDCQNQVSQLYGALKEKHDEINNAPDLQKDKLYQLCLKRDGMAFNVIKKHQQKVNQTSLSHFNPETLKNAANRFERYTAVKGSLDMFISNPEIENANIVEINKIDLKKDYSHLNRLCLDKKVKPNEFYKFIEDAQKPMRIAFYDSLKEKHSELRDYEKLINQRKKVFGHERKKIDLAMQVLCKKITRNSVLTAALENRLPKLAKIIRQTISNDLDRGIDR
jgi:Ti-type conjugative transfer relaxase TraA